MPPPAEEEEDPPSCCCSLPESRARLALLGIEERVCLLMAARMAELAPPLEAPRDEKPELETLEVVLAVSQPLLRPPCFIVTIIELLPFFFKVGLASEGLPFSRLPKLFWRVGPEEREGAGMDPSELAIVIEALENDGWQGCTTQSLVVRQAGLWGKGLLDQRVAGKFEFEKIAH